MFRTLLLLLAIATPAFAQGHQNRPFPPHKIADDLYYVGTAELSSYLIHTNAGLILINPSFEDSVPLIQASVEKLGFKFQDVKILLISHAHDDHTAGAAAVKRMTGAKFMVMDRDVPEIEDGGLSDFHYPNQRWAAVKVDRILHDDDKVSLGQFTLTAHLTPGHTKGCTTWTFPVQSNGKTLQAVIVGSPNVNAGYRLVGNQKYPAIAKDYRQCFAVLKRLPCDIFLGAHGAYYGLDKKYSRSLTEGSAAFVDPAGYKEYVAERERAFERELSKQSAGR